MVGGSRFCQLLNEAIMDEKSAWAEYGRLRKHAPTKTTRKTIDRIANQEGKHAKTLRGLHSKYCGRRRR